MYTHTHLGDGKVKMIFGKKLSLSCFFVVSQDKWAHFLKANIVECVCVGVLCLD